MLVISTSCTTVELGFRHAHTEEERNEDRDKGLIPVVFMQITFLPKKSSCNFALLVRKKNSRETSRPIKQQTNQSINHSLSQLTNQSNAENLLFPCVALLTICFWHHRKKVENVWENQKHFFFPFAARNCGHCWLVPCKVGGHPA